MQFHHTAQCHRCRKFWGSVQLTCWLQECPSDCWPWIECYLFLYHKSSPKAFRRICQYIQPASQTQTTCNHTSPDLHIQHLYLQDHLRPATGQLLQQSVLLNQIISAQTVRNRLREAHRHARHPHRGLDLTAVRHRNWLEWANAHTLERFGDTKCLAL